jgi:hypothetical protein
MTRTGDVAIPDVEPHPLAPGAPLARWRPWRPVIALEVLPQAAYVWDDADPDVVWDDDDPERVWDAPFVGGGFTDAACDFVTLDVDPGEPDELYLFPPVSATLTLANADGAYTPWSADGRLVYWAPGRRFAAYWRNVDTAEERWMFSGRVASWTVNADGTVTVVAFDGLAALAQPIGPWTPGAPGDTPRARILSIAATAQYVDPVVADVGNVTLSTAATTDAPLELIETAALSDGGLFYGDADGSLHYRDRLWRAGRDDQDRVWTVSDNVCTVPVVVWDPEAASDDERLATVVRLVNVAGLIAEASVDATLWAGDARFVLTHPDPDQWTTQAEGDALAAYLIGQQSTPSMAVNGFDLYGLDPHQPAVADFTTGLRRGDRVNVIHDFTDANGDPATLDVTSIALAVAHNLTPETWVSHVRLSRTVDYRTVELWDRTIYVWDQVDPNNVWRY